MSARLRRRGGGPETSSLAGGTRSRGGKVAAASVVATIAGVVIKDLSRPNSLIRGLVALGSKKLAAWREAKPAIDVGEAVEIEIIDDSTSDISTDKKSRTEQED